MEELELTLNATTGSIFIQYNALFNAFPEEWKLAISNLITPQQNEDNQDIFTSFYDVLDKLKGWRARIKENISVPCCVGFWLHKYNIDIDTNTWLTAFNATKEVRLRELHWKIIHNIYPTNIMLHKMKIKDSNRCSYCLHDVDFLEHFFFECTIVRQFWVFIESELFQLINSSIKGGKMAGSIRDSPQV